MAAITTTERNRGINPAPIKIPSNDGQEVDVYDLIGQQLASRMGASNSPIDANAIASALGSGGAVNTPMGGDPADLFGLMPDQVSEIAKNRSNIQYQSMLSNIGALDFTQKLQGTEGDRALSSKLIEGEQQRQTSLELNSITKQMNERIVKVQAEAQKDPIKMKQLAIFDRMKRGDKTVTTIEKELAGELFKGQFDAAKALTYIQNAPMLVAAGISDAETVSATIKLLQPIINRAAKDFLNTDDGLKKDLGEPIAKDNTGKDVYKDSSGSYVYKDGTPWTAPKKGK